MHKIDRKARILVIDDQQVIRDFLSSELSSRGFSVVTASDGEEGIENVKQKKFDLVISDIKMSKKDGIEILDEIKKISSDTEVIMVTAFGTIELVLSAMKKGAFSFIEKPFNIEEILVLINKAMEKRNLEFIVDLYKTSNAIFSTIKFENLLKMIINLTYKILNVEDVSIMFIGDDGKLYIAESTGLDDEIKNKTRISIGDSIAGKVAQMKEPVIINGPVKDDPRFSCFVSMESKKKIKSAIIHPLIVNGEVVGVLNANRINNTEHFTNDDVKYSTIFTSQIAQAIANSRLYKELEKKIEEIEESNMKLKTATASLIQAEKLSSLGELTAGVAHELNNPLNTVKIICQSNLRDLQRGRFDEETCEDDLTEAILRVDEMAKIIDHMRIFTRRIGDVPFEKVDINNPIEGVFRLIGQQLKVHNIEVIKEISSDVMEVIGDSIKLEQILTNLITNARDAVEKSPKPDGMKIWVRAYKIQETNGKAQVMIEVEDNGSGIPENIRDKIFEQFFTTKPPGKGTGLGLSIAQKIVEEHKGHIKLSSELKKGTKFSIKLPAVVV